MTNIGMLTVVVLLALAIAIQKVIISYSSNINVLSLKLDSFDSFFVKNSKIGLFC